jgi:serine/threonine-protein kinase
MRMREEVTTRAGSTCARCGYVADASRGAVNFCPSCGDDLRKIVAETEPGPDPESTNTTAWTGQVIADRYRLLRIIGEGGMGSVFKAEHIRMGKALAVKLLRGGVARDAASVARFRAEAQIVSRLSHPHTIAVFDFGEIGNASFYLAMEYVPGKDLALLLHEQGRLSEARSIGIMEQVLGSLAEAHEMSVVHRDVKPANIMVMERREGDFVKLLDFGIAKLRDLPGAVPAKGAILGTPSYLAPEQARGVEADGRADLYAVGAVLFELAAGRPPFLGPPGVVRAAHIHEPPPQLTDLAPVSRAFADVVHKALSKRPMDRYPTAHAMREALLAVKSGLPSEARPEATSGTRLGSLPPSLLTPLSPERVSLELANREDFEALERERRSMRRARTVAPAAALAVLVAGAVLGLRWGEVYPLLARRAPRLAAMLPSAARPIDLFDGDEHEPNDTPANANVLMLPVPGVKASDQPGRGPGAVRGLVGAPVDRKTGDVDLYRIEVPDTGRRLVLTAEWGAERAPSEGIHGLEVKLTLNREQSGGDLRPAPLVAQVDRGVGRPARLTALTIPGTYYLAVREQHPDGAKPVERW